MSDANIAQIEHLIVLVEVVYKDNHDPVMFDDVRFVLYRQLQATYSWLNNPANGLLNFNSLNDSYPNFSHRPLFLNVDHSRDKWRFVSASQLCFGQSRDAINGSLFSPRRMLASLKRLLLGCGAQKVIPFAAKQDTKSYPEKSIHKLHDDLRQSQLFLDVRLVSSHDDGDSTEYDLTAHRSFLGAIVPHVRDSLISGMAENIPSPDDGLYRIHYDFSAFTLSMVIGMTESIHLLTD